MAVLRKSQKMRMDRMLEYYDTYMYYSVELLPSERTQGTWIQRYGSVAVRILQGTCRLYVRA